MVVRTAPTSTTNMTGFFSISRGSSLRKESATARDRIAASGSDFLRMRATESMATSKDLSRVHQQMFENRPEAQGREKRERADDHDSRYKQAAEERAGDGKGAGGLRHGLLDGQAAGYGHNRNDHEKTAEQLRCRGRCVVPHGVATQAGESRTVVSRGRRVRVKDLRQPVRTRVRNSRRAI